MAKRLQCPRCSAKKYWILRRGKRQCPPCHYEWAPDRLPLRLSSHQWAQVLGWFCRGLSTYAIAQETGLERRRVLRALTLLRQAMAGAVPPVFRGTGEIDET